MNDLNALLERAAGPTSAPVDGYADLTRAQRALSRTRRRRRALGLAGVATAGVVGVGLVRLPHRGDTAEDRAGHGQVSSEPPGSATIGTPWARPGPDLTAGPYTFPAIPQGWEVQGHRPQLVTIAPVGFADQEPLSFPGKLVIGYDQNPPSGRAGRPRRPDVLRRRGRRHRDHRRRNPGGRARRRGHDPVPHLDGLDRRRHDRVPGRRPGRPGRAAGAGLAHGRPPRGGAGTSPPPVGYGVREPHGGAVTEGGDPQVHDRSVADPSTGTPRAGVVSATSR